MTGAGLLPYLFWASAAVMTASVAHMLARRLDGCGRLPLVVMAAIPAVALPVYLWLGRPELTAWHTRPGIPPMIASAMDDLKQTAKDHPGDPSAWVLLGDVDMKLQHYPEAETAYRTALKITPSDPAISVDLGLALVRKAGGRVTQDAIALFEAAPVEPEARYYLALARSQQADWNGAMADWKALAASARPGDAWLPLAEDRVRESRRVLGIDRGH